MAVWPYCARRKWPNWPKKITSKCGGGGGPVVSMLAFYFDDPSSNDAETYIVL